MDSTLRRPYLITCPFEEVDGKVPKFVSLTASSCDNAENLMEIIDNQPSDGTKKKFGVCTKQLSYKNQEVATKFIEWVHLLKILGAEKIHLRNKYVHKDFFAIMNHFEEKNLIEVQPFLEPSGISDTDLDSIQTYMLEQNILNDCFYRVRNLYEYVIFLDIDEIIVPNNQADNNWSDMLKTFFASMKRFKVPRDAYYTRHVYFPKIETSFNEIPKHHNMLSQIQRSANFSEKLEFSKSFNNPDKIIAVHNHNPIICFHRNGNECKLKSISENIAQLNHYRHQIDESEISATVEDKTLWKYKDELIKAVKETMEATNFKPTF
jgi:Glycosyltransferase family 92